MASRDVSRSLDWWLLPLETLEGRRFIARTHSYATLDSHLTWHKANALYDADLLAPVIIHRPEGNILNRRIFESINVLEARQ